MRRFPTFSAPKHGSAPIDRAKRDGAEEAPHPSVVAPQGGAVPSEHRLTERSEIGAEEAPHQNGRCSTIQVTGAWSAVNRSTAAAHPGSVPRFSASLMARSVPLRRARSRVASSHVTSV
jgi:hypothetical protein